MGGPTVYMGCGRDGLAVPLPLTTETDALGTTRGVWRQDGSAVRLQDRGAAVELRVAAGTQGGAFELQKPTGSGDLVFFVPKDILSHGAGRLQLRRGLTGKALQDFRRAVCDPLLPQPPTVTAPPPEPKAPPVPPKPYVPCCDDLVHYMERPIVEPRVERIFSRRLSDGRCVMGLSTLDKYLGTPEQCRAVDAFDATIATLVAEQSAAQCTEIREAYRLREVNDGQASCEYTLHFIGGGISFQMSSAAACGHMNAAYAMADALHAAVRSQRLLQADYVSTNLRRLGPFEAMDLWEE